MYHPFISLLALEDANETIGKLETELKHAKAEIARSKEDSKSIRKRLAGCHFHYKQLQQEYETAVKEKDDLEYRMIKTANYNSVLKTQTDSLTREVEELQEKSRASGEEIERMKNENQDLRHYCDDLMKLASKSVIAM